MYDAPAAPLSEAELRLLDAEYCSWGDTVHYVDQPKFFESCDGSFMFDADGRSYLDLQMWYSTVNFGYRNPRLVEAAHRQSLDKQLRVQTYVTASIRWLAKRVPQFLREHPHIKLALSTCAVEWEFDDIHADVGLVYYEADPGPKYHWAPLFEYALYPVCSPAMATRVGPQAQARDLLNHPLVIIHTEVRNWETWFASAGETFDPSSNYLVVDTLAVALELALSGQAIALVNGPFVDDDLAEGRLVRPVGHKLVCPGEWGLICRKELQENPAVKAFVDWMANSAGAPEAFSQVA